MLKPIRRMLEGVVVAALLLASTANAAVIWDASVDHSALVGTAAAKLAGSLGTGSASFSGSTSAGWSVMVPGLTSSDVLLLGQASNEDVILPADVAAIQSFVSGGGALISLWGQSPRGFSVGDPNLDLLNAVTGETLVWQFGGSTGTPGIDKNVANAAGTSFGGVPPALTLTGANNHGGIQLTSLGGGISMYESAITSLSHVAVFNVGAGHAAFLSWDWCCGDGVGVRDEWDEVLLAAALYRVPEPGTLALLGLGFLALGARRRARLSPRTP